MVKNISKMQYAHKRIYNLHFAYDSMPIDDLSCFREFPSASLNIALRNVKLFDEQLFWRIREPKTVRCLARNPSTLVDG